MRTGAGAAWRRVRGGLEVTVRLTPRAARDEVVGIGTAAGGPAILARVRALPEDGAANRALTEVVAGWIGVPRSTVALAGGARSRVKTLRVTGDGAALEAKVASAVTRLAGS